MEGEDGKEGVLGGEIKAEAEKVEFVGENMSNMAGLSRKEKRKLMKKLKRKQIRREIAEKEREEEERSLNDPKELEKLKAMEEEEARMREIALKEFEEREREWIRAMELKKKMEEEREEEENRQRAQEESQSDQAPDQNGMEEDEWDYVEEGPAEIIFQGNEIIFKKKKVRIPKKDGKHHGEDADRPTSNPLPPQTEMFADYQNGSKVQQALENAAQQVPNFGTEQDKAHCPFHLKTGACRFGHRCSRVHFYPDKSCTLLVKNMYNGPGLAWEQDEGLEFTDEEIDSSYEEFYEDVHTEFLKFGEIVNFKVCRNGSFHLRGNVYVHYRSLESALLAYQSINGRYFAGKQVKCEYVNVTRWKVAICGEYMKSGFKSCSHGTACNFIHCFRNPGGDYEWADWDKPPPRYWLKKMVALFGYSDSYVKQVKDRNMDILEGTKKKDLHRRCSRSKSRDNQASDERGSSLRNETAQGSCRADRCNQLEDDHGDNLSDDSRTDHKRKAFHNNRIGSDYTRKILGPESRWSKQLLDREGGKQESQDSSHGYKRRQNHLAMEGLRHRSRRKKDHDHLGKTKDEQIHHGRWQSNQRSPDHAYLEGKPDTNSITERSYAGTDEQDRDVQSRIKVSIDDQKVSGRSPDYDSREEKNNHANDLVAENSDEEIRHRKSKKDSSRNYSEISEQEDAHGMGKRKINCRSEDRGQRHSGGSRRRCHKLEDSSEDLHATPDERGGTGGFPRETLKHRTDHYGEGKNEGRKRLYDETLVYKGGKSGKSAENYMPCGDYGKINETEDDRWRPENSD